PIQRPTKTMIRNHGAQKIKQESGHLSQYASLVRDAGGQDVIERGDAVGGDDQEPVAVLVNVADFAAGAQLEAGQIGLEQHGTGWDVGCRGQTQLYWGIRMLLSILIPVYNERTVVEQSLALALAAPLPENMARELVVVD